MSTEATEAVEFHGRTIDDGRFHRAATESMSVEFDAPGIAAVDSASGNTYDVDLVGGSCTCPDHTHNGAEFVCKHATRAALVALFDDGQRLTEFVAAVARVARDRGCEHGIEWCNGPNAPSDAEGGHPCPGCVEAAAGGDDWAVWTALRAAVRVADAGHDAGGEAATDAGAPKAVADGGHVESDESERGAVDVSPCPGCGAPTTGDTCGRRRCEVAGEIDEEPL